MIERDPPSRFRPPRETPFIMRLRGLLADRPDDTRPKRFIRWTMRVREHIATATDDDLNDLVRLSVQLYPEQYTGSFDEILEVMRERRDTYRSIADTTDP